jgi:glycosyltransferase involved in cell wall biosynthesis
MPLISIFLTSYNHAKYLREAIDSALAQTFTDFELIIWDDASSDDSWGIINSYSDSRIKAFRNDETRRGLYGINKSITEIATGEYIAIHHSDDIWEKEKLEKQIEFLDDHPEIGAVFTNALAVRDNGGPLKDPGHFYLNIFDQPNRTRHEWLNHFFYHGNALCHPSVLIRKQCYDVCGLYRFGLAQIGDFDMWIRLCLKFDVHVLPEKLVRFRVRDNEANTSGNRPETRIRVAIEYFLALKSFLQIDSFEEMVAIFPEAKKYYRADGFESDFVLAMISIENKTFHFTKIFGLEIIFAILNDETRSNRVKSLYGFDYRDFIALTAKHDVLSVEAVARIAERDGQIAERDGQLAERDGQLAERDGQLAERDGQLEAMRNSTSWCVTQPLRWAERQLRHIKR